MKILQLGKFYPPDIGGIENVMYDITEGLNERGIKCDVLCSNKVYSYKEDSINGYKVYRTKSFGKFASTSITPQMIIKLKNLIKLYDVIHIHLPDPMANMALFLVDNKDKKIVIHWHSDIVKQKYLLKFYEPLQNWLLKRADKIIATTPKYIEESKYLNKFKEKTIAIPIGIDINKFVVNDSLVTKIRKKYKNKKIIFSLGRLVYYKGFEYLIKSAKYLDDNHIILIGGEGELKNKLQNLIEKNNLQNKVFLMGKIPFNELGSYYKTCDIFCLPSIEKSEAFGIVQIEAMAFGKPVVATKIKGSGIDWVNQDGVSGINVEPKNPIELAKAFKKILGNDNIYNMFSKNTLDRYEKLFKKEVMIRSIVNFYENLL